MSRSLHLRRVALRGLVLLALAASSRHLPAAADDPSAGASSLQQSRADPSKDGRVTTLLNQQAGAARRVGEMQTGNVQGRLQQLHGDDSALCDRTPPPPKRVSIAAEAGNPSPPELPSSAMPPLPAPAALSASTAAAAPVSLPFASCQRTPLATGWSAGSVEVGAGDAPIGGQGFGFHSKGLTLGADRRVSRQLVLGAGVGLAHERADLAGDGVSNGADAMSAVVYVGYRPTAALTVDALVGQGELQMRSARRLGERTSTAAERPGSQRFASVAAGYRLGVGGADLAPYTRLDALQSTLRPYAENDGAADALQFQRQSAPSLKFAVGIEGSSRIETRYGALSPRGKLEMRHELEAAGSAAIQYVDGASGPSYAVDATAVPRNALSAGFGANLALRDSWSFGAGYAVDVANNTRVSRLDLKLTRSLR